MERQRKLMHIICIFDFHYPLCSLLDILAKRKGTSGLSQTITGSVLLNGEHLPGDFNLRTGYVVQVYRSAVAVYNHRG